MPKSPEGFEGVIDPLSKALDIAFPGWRERLRCKKMMSRYPPDVIGPQVALAVIGRRMKSKVIPMILEEFAEQRVAVDGQGRDDLIALIGARVPEGEGDED